MAENVEFSRNLSDVRRRFREATDFLIQQIEAQCATTFVVSAKGEFDEICEEYSRGIINFIEKNEQIDGKEDDVNLALSKLAEINDQKEICNECYSSYINDLVSTSQVGKKQCLASRNGSRKSSVSRASSRRSAEVANIRAGYLQQKEMTKIEQSRNEMELEELKAQQMTEREKRYAMREEERRRREEQQKREDEEWERRWRRQNAEIKDRYNIKDANLNIHLANLAAREEQEIAEVRSSRGSGCGTNDSPETPSLVNIRSYANPVLPTSEVATTVIPRCETSRTSSPMMMCTNFQSAIRPPVRPVSNTGPVANANLIPAKASLPTQRTDNIYTETASVPKFHSTAGWSNPVWTTKQSYSNRAPVLDPVPALSPLRPPQNNCSHPNVCTHSFANDDVRLLTAAVKESFSLPKAPTV